jgi:flagellar biosynthesis/type III secretory pathway protein FliH
VKELTDFDSGFDDGYSIGFAEGRREGYDLGYIACTEEYEARFSKMWAELQTLNARIDYFERALEDERD